MTPGFSIHISDTQISIENHLNPNIYDNIVMKNNDLEIIIEGLILNKKKLLHQNSSSNFPETLEKLYHQKKENSIQDLEGEFRGFIWDKNLKRIFVFTNATSTQRIFYTKTENQISIDTHLVRLNQSAKNQKITQNPDIEAFYQLLTFGNLLENKTPIENVFKILDGHFLEIDTENLNLNEKKYFDLENINYFSGTKNSAIDKIDEVFRNSVELEYEKDNELQKNHFSLISGGLDSRVALFYALKINQKPDDVFCFSQKNYLDEKISTNIAQEFGLKYHFVSLDGGEFLNKIDELTKISEGTALFTGGIHVQHAMENLKLNNFGIIHGGQIGDGILGGFNTVPYRKKPSNFKIVINEKFLPKISKNLSEIKQNYESEELFYLRNVAYNRTVLGAQVLQQFAYQTSPFMTKDFLEFAISLPEKWKINQNFYIDWIQKYCKEATKFTWERTLMKPNAKWKTKVGEKFNKRFFKIWNEKILRNPQKASMYPYQFYYNQSIDLQEFYQNYFDKNIHRLEAFPELKKDVIWLFGKNKFQEKTLAINVLSIFKLYF